MNKKELINELREIYKSEIEYFFSKASKCDYYDLFEDNREIIIPICCSTEENKECMCGGNKFNCTYYGNDKYEEAVEEIAGNMSYSITNDLGALLKYQLKEERAKAKKVKVIRKYKKGENNER